MPLPGPLLTLLTVRAALALIGLLATVLAVSLIAWRTLREARPQDRPSLLRALAELARALR